MIPAFLRPFAFQIARLAPFAAICAQAGPARSPPPRNSPYPILLESDKTSAYLSWVWLRERESLLQRANEKIVLCEWRQ